MGVVIALLGDTLMFMGAALFVASVIIGVFVWALRGKG